MKNVHIVALLGGAAALAYLATRGKKAHAAPLRVRGTTAPTSSGEMFLNTIEQQPSTSGFFVDPRPGGNVCLNLRGDQVDMRHCGTPASSLEGYFPTGALAADEYRTSYDHGHDHSVPCCSGCAQGRGCAG